MASLSLEAAALRQRHSNHWGWEVVSCINPSASLSLAAHLAEIETAAEKMVTRLVAQMAQNEGVTEELKAADPQRWTGLMNNLKHSAEETVLNDLIYS